MYIMKFTHMIVFSAYAEVVPSWVGWLIRLSGILRAYGGSSWDGAEDFSDDLYSPRARR